MLQCWGLRFQTHIVFEAYVQDEKTSELSKRVNLYQIMRIRSKNQTYNNLISI